MSIVRIGDNASRLAIACAVTAAAYLVVVCSAAPPAHAATVCTWGGTTLEPTGVFTIHPGITNTPASEPLYAKAVGTLGGGASCNGKVTYTGEFDPGSTCSVFTLHGTVSGLPGVARFWGGGSAISVDLLYDKFGNVVGSDQPDLVTAANVLGSTACNTPEGFTKGQLSFDIELFGNHA